MTTPAKFYIHREAPPIGQAWVHAGENLNSKGVGEFEPTETTALGPNKAEDGRFDSADAMNGVAGVYELVAVQG